MFNITLYTTHCPKCLILKRFMDEKEMFYDIIDDVDLVVKQGAEVGIQTAPFLCVNGKEYMEFQEALEYVKGVN